VVETPLLAPGCKGAIFNKFLFFSVRYIRNLHPCIESRIQSKM
jgi:hypothetical protein